MLFLRYVWRIFLYDVRKTADKDKTIRLTETVRSAG
jgi:hypothetical protein